MAGGGQRRVPAAAGAWRLGQLLTEHEVSHDVKIYPGVGQSRLLDRAADILERVDFTPNALRDDLAREPWSFMKP